MIKKKNRNKKNQRVVGLGMDCGPLRMKDSKPEMKEIMKKKGGLDGCRNGADW